MLGGHQLRQVIRQFGVHKGLLYLADRSLNKVILLDCLHIIVLERGELQQVTSLIQAPAQDVSYRFATEQDLLGLRQDPSLCIDDALMDHFRQGDRCLLSCVGTKVAGYTWAHLEGNPLILPGLRIKIPDRYIYNYAGFTDPLFRGSNLQSLRHHALLHQSQWKEKSGLLGYVRHTNWQSIRGHRSPRELRRPIRIPCRFANASAVRPLRWNASAIAIPAASSHLPRSDGGDHSSADSFTMFIASTSAIHTGTAVARPEDGGNRAVTWRLCRDVLDEYDFRFLRGFLRF